MKAYSQSPSSDLLALNPQRSDTRCFKWHLCTYDCDFLPVWQPFLLEVLVLETSLWSSKMRMKEKSFQRCDRKENVFFPLLALRKMQKELNHLCWILSYSDAPPPKKRKGYKCSGGVAGWEWEWGEWGEGRKHHQVAPWMRWIRVSSHLLKLCGPWFCPRTSWGGGGGRAKLGMGRCEGWGEGGCWGRGEQWLNSDRAFLLSEGGLGMGVGQWGGSQ